ncbi:MAG: response regulator [Pirellulales bacterium]|nr:response regulator [Pirellulales bacterium]
MPHPESNMTNQASPETARLKSAEARIAELEHELANRSRLEELYAFMQASIDHAPDMVLWTGRDGRIIWANQTAAQGLGFSRPQLVARLLSEVAPEFPASLWNGFWDERSPGEAIATETRVRRQDGVLVPVEARVTRMVVHQTHYCCLIARDVSSRKHAEAELSEYTAELYEARARLEQQTIELEMQAWDLREARVHAEQASQAKSEFLANMSHEIRTPMTAILGFTNVLLEDNWDLATVESLRTIKRNGEYLLELINDILDLSKIEAGKLSVEHLRCSPLQIISEVQALMQVRADAANLPLRIEYDGEIPQTIITDPTRLRQVLINLVANAIKFTKRGQIRLVTRLVQSEQGRPRLEFEVIDTGIGMSEAQLAKLFRPFTQADMSTSRKFGGTGLGLTISKRLMEMLGGSLTVNSRLGSGSTFRIRIPTGKLTDVTMVKPPTETRTGRGGAVDTLLAPSEVRSVAQRLDGVRILLAEDGIDNQRLITHVLCKAGAQVEVVENGKLATELVLATMPIAAKGAATLPPAFDVVLMDIQMPEMDGYAATQLLRDAGYEAPIIALTAHAMASDREKCLSAGFDDYATKPIDRDRLLQTIAEHAQGRAGIMLSPLAADTTAVHSAGANH